MILVPRNLRCYLDTCAIGDLALAPELRDQRSLFLGLGGSHGDWFRCATSVEAVAQIVSAKDDGKRHRLLEFVERINSRWGIFHTQTQVLGAWLRGEGMGRPVHPLAPMGWSQKLRSELHGQWREGRDHIADLQVREQELRPMIADVLKQAVEKRPSGYWTNDANLFALCTHVADEFLCPDSDGMRELFRDAAKGVDDEQLELVRRKHPWVRAYTAHVVVGSLRLLLNQTKKAKLKDEPIDRIHLVYASFNNFFVTSDGFLKRFAEHYLKETSVVVAKPGPDLERKLDEWMASNRIDQHLGGQDG